MRTKVVFISGKQGSGKSTLASNLMAFAKSQEWEPYRTRNAKVLYEMHDAVRAVGEKYNIPMAVKESVLLQLLGTEWGRNVKGQDIWVNALKNDILSNCPAEDVVQRIVLIDDLRFKNELSLSHSLKQLGYQTYTIRLEASEDTRKVRTDAWRDNTTHQSEVDLDDSLTSFDLVLRTDVLNQEDVLNEVVCLVDGCTCELCMDTDSFGG